MRALDASGLFLRFLPGERITEVAIVSRILRAALLGRFPNGELFLC